MLALLIVGALTAVTAVPSVMQDAASLTVQQEWMSELEAQIPLWMEADGVPGLNVLVLSGGETTLAASFGVMDRSSKRPMRRGSVFRVESISKPVTAWGVMKLVEEGRLSPDSPVEQILESWVPPSGTPEFTVRQLLTHTAGIGLGDFSNRYPAGGPVPDVRHSLTGEFRIDAPPGSRFSYSDTGYNLLEVLVEDVTGEQFASWMTREILDPLGMGEASFEWSASYADRISTGHTLRGTPVSPYVYPGRGSGGLFATIDDVARFVRAGMAPPYNTQSSVLDVSTVELMQTPVAEPGGLFGLVSDGYALGHFTETLSDGRRSVWHGGQGYGWMTHAQWIPETGDGIILLSNSQRAWPLFGRVLESWSDSLGVEPVGMSLVRLARPIALGLILALLIGVAIQSARIVTGLLRGSRRWPPGVRFRPPMRMAVAGTGVCLVGIVVWASLQEYLFIFSILPGLIRMLGGSMVAAGLVLIATAAWPAGSGNVRSSAGA